MSKKFPRHMSCEALALRLVAIVDHREGRAAGPEVPTPDA